MWSMPPVIAASKLPAPVGLSVVTLITWPPRPPGDREGHFDEWRAYTIAGLLDDAGFDVELQVLSGQQRIPGADFAVEPHYLAIERGVQTEIEEVVIPVGLVEGLDVEIQRPIPLYTLEP